MKVTQHLLTKLCIVAALVGIIAPSFYAYAVEVEDEPGRNAIEAINKQNNENDIKNEDDLEDSSEGIITTPAINAAARAARLKVACNKVRTSISNRTAHLQQLGDRHLSVIDKVYTNLTTFANDNSLSITEADGAAVQSARETAHAAILRLASTEDALNCEDTNAGQTAAALRIQIQNVNTALHNYRKAVGAMLSTIKAETQKAAAL